MNRKDLVNTISLATGFTKKQTNIFLSTFVNTVIKEVAQGGEIKLVGFGNFFSKEKKARRGVNPQTMEITDYPAQIVPRFKSSKEFKDALKKKDV